MYGRLTWWNNHYGNLSINKISAVIVREGLKKLESTNFVRGDGYYCFHGWEIE